MVQVELFDSALLNADKISDLSYAHKMSEPVPWFKVPQRIFERYFENAEFLVNAIQSIGKPSVQSDQDTHGFKKTLVLLTKCGKLFAVSSYDGSIKWSYYNPYEKIIKVFVE